jgi:hypothetical protein
MADPIEKTEELVDEAREGRSERTPWLILSGLQLALGLVFVVIFGIVFAVYLIF